MTDFSDLRARLDARLAELEGRLQKIDTHLDQPHSRNWDEAATEREDDEVLEELGQDGLQEIKSIRAAISRMEDGSYGTCVECGEAISAERLQAVPSAALCRTCAH